MKKKEKEEFKKQVIVQQSLLSSIRYYIHNAYNEMKRRFCYFCLAFFSVMLVATSAAVAQSVIDRAPIIFLKASEGPVGEIDITIDTNSEVLNNGQFSSNESYLNMTKIQEIFKDDRSQQLTPRFEVVGDLVSNGNSQCKIDSTDLLSIFNSANQCFIAQQSTLYFLDQKQEQKIGVGRSWEVTDLKEEEVLIHKKMATQLGVKVGDKIYFRSSNFKNFVLNVLESMCSPQLSDQKQNEEQNQYCQDIKIEITNYKPKYSDTVIPFTVGGIFDQSNGKFGDGAIDSFIICEYQQIGKILAEYYGLELQKLQDRQKSKFLQYLRNINPQQYAWRLLMNLKNRYDIYINTNYDNIQYQVTSVSANIVRDLGIYPIKVDMPVLKELQGNSQASMFLGIILNLIIFVLFVLSIMLLYNLLLVSIETKNFELGVLRVLGLNKFGVICLIIFQSLFYVLPSVFCGLLISILFLKLISMQLYSLLNVEIAPTPTGNAVALSLLLGIAIPLVSSIIPIQEALKQTLGVALDQQRNKSQAVKIEIDVEGKGIPWGIISFSIITSMFGISIYYLLPLALLSLDFALLIAIFFWILVGLLVGFILFALNMQHILEKFIIIVFFFWTKAAIRTIIQKNLASHRLKNRRTAIMYGLSIAFVIFVWTAMSVQINSSDFQTRRYRGVYMEVYAKDDYLDIDAYENIIASQLGDAIESFSWVTGDLNSVGKALGYQKNYLTHIGRVYEVYPEIVAVSPNFLQTVFTEDFLDIYQSSNSGLDIIEELYTPRGSQSIILAKSQVDSIGASLDYNNPILNIMFNNTYSKTFQMRVSSIVNQMPGAAFSSIPTNRKLNGIVSLPTFCNLVGNYIQNYTDIPMKNLKLKIKSGKQGFVYDTLKKNINEKSLAGKIWDYRDYQNSNSQQKALINVIFSVLALIVMALCFFSLVSSMTANIFEQTKEIAVLRAVGLTKLRMKTVYVFEAFTLVFSSCIMGICIGIIVGFTMSMQRALFTELPIKFTFPYEILIVIFIASVICAYLSTFLPTNNILKEQISTITRMTN